MVPEAPLEQTEHGLMLAGGGWFVPNAREARWFDTGRRGKEPGLRGKGDFPQLGLGLTVLEPGEPMSMYYRETDQEDFLALAGEALLIVEGEERRLRPFCSRVDGTLEGRDDWGAYTVDEAARRHGAGVEEETNDAGVAYARFPELEPTRYRDGWLPADGS